MKLRTLHDADLDGKRVLVRADLNVPIKDGVIQDDTRIQACLPTLNYLLERGCSVIVMTHFGRPKGQVMPEMRVDGIGVALSEALGREVKKLDDCVGSEVEVAVAAMKAGDVILLENTRFHAEEKENGEEFSKALAGLAEVYVNDAFGTIHRAHASTVGVAKILPAYAGLLVEREVEVLSSVLTEPKKPVCLVMGGAKIDTKIGILQKFLNRADYFLIGGALANTFLAAEGYEVGNSLYQEDKLDVARDFLLSAESKREYVYLPSDAVVSDKVSADSEALDMRLEGVGEEMMILDIGVLTAETFAKCIREAGTILWNGPMGLYEFPGFANGTKVVAEAIAESEATSIVGGGDSIDAINKLGIPSEKFTHISTGGGAMLEFLEGKTLPGVEVLLD
jgi:phosphoglycerate kinase